jgi:hypothetical protein
VVSPPDDRPATTTLEVAIKIPAPTTAALPAGATAAPTTHCRPAHAEALREGRREHHEGRRDGSDNRNFREHVFLSGKKNNGLVART